MLGAIPYSRGDCFGYSNNSEGDVSRPFLPLSQIDEENSLSSQRCQSETPVNTTNMPKQSHSWTLVYTQMSMDSLCFIKNDGVALKGQSLHGVCAP